jgi:hypothetical protein
VAPCDVDAVAVGDIVLVKVSGIDYLHLIKVIDGRRLPIGNNRGGIHGWVGPDPIHRRAVEIRGN